MDHIWDIHGIKCKFMRSLSIDGIYYLMGFNGILMGS